MSQRDPGAKQVAIGGVEIGRLEPDGPSLYRALRRADPRRIGQLPVEGHVELQLALAVVNRVVVAHFWFPRASASGSRDFPSEPTPHRSLDEYGDEFAHRAVEAEPITCRHQKYWA